MSDLEHRKQLLLTKIDAHRQIIRLEVRAAQVTFDPLGLALRWMGLDHSLVSAVLPAARELLRTGLTRGSTHPEILIAVCAAVIASWAGVSHRAPS